MPLATIYDPRESHLSSLAAEEAIHYAMPDASASAAVTPLDLWFKRG